MQDIMELGAKARAKGLVLNFGDLDPEIPGYEFELKKDDVVVASAQGKPRPIAFRLAEKAVDDYVVPA